MKLLATTTTTFLALAMNVLCASPGNDLVTAQTAPDGTPINLYLDRIEMATFAPSVVAEMTRGSETKVTQRKPQASNMQGGSLGAYRYGRPLAESESDELNFAPLAESGFLASADASASPAAMEELGAQLAPEALAEGKDYVVALAGCDDRGRLQNAWTGITSIDRNVSTNLLYYASVRDFVPGRLDIAMRLRAHVSGYLEWRKLRNGSALFASTPRTYANAFAGIDVELNAKFLHFQTPKFKIGTYEIYVHGDVGIKIQVGTTVSLRFDNNPYERGKGFFNVSGDVYLAGIPYVEMVAKWGSATVGAGIEGILRGNVEAMTYSCRDDDWYCDPNNGNSTSNLRTAGFSAGISGRIYFTAKYGNWKTNPGWGISQPVHRVLGDTQRNLGRAPSSLDWFM